MGHWQMRGCGIWAVEAKATAELLGTLGFSDPAGWPGFELAWTLARRFWGQGYATEGARAALVHAFTVLDRDRVISLIHPANQASIRVAERLGERLEGSVEMFGEERLVYAIGRGSGAPGLRAGWMPRPRSAASRPLRGGGDQP
jgi:RimJ/RimL family protein N-acetyltransferase